MSKEWRNIPSSVFSMLLSALWKERYLVVVVYDVKELPPVAPTQACTTLQKFTHALGQFSLIGDRFVKLLAGCFMVEERGLPYSFELDIHACINSDSVSVWPIATMSFCLGSFCSLKFFDKFSRLVGYFDKITSKNTYLNNPVKKLRFIKLNKTSNDDIAGNGRP